MLSFTLSGKHFLYRNINTDDSNRYQIFRHSHNEIIQLLRLIQTYAYSDFYLSHSDLILTQELHLWQTYPYLDLILIALILIQVLYL